MNAAKDSTVNDFQTVQVFHALERTVSENSVMCLSPPLLHPVQSGLHLQG